MATEADINLRGLSIWVDGREFPDSTDYYDGNWLTIRAVMEAHLSRVECRGSILMTTDLKGFRDQLVVMSRSLAGKANLEGFEPDLKVVLKMGGRGEIEGRIEITPDHMTQHHRFDVELDQSYLPQLISCCDDILERFPVINT